MASTLEENRKPTLLFRSIRGTAVNILTFGVLLVHGCCASHTPFEEGWDAAARYDSSSPDVPNPACDDGNPCTEDLMVSGECIHPPREDGIPCDDGDRCTRSDQCMAGSCLGAAGQFGPPRVLGEARPRYQGVLRGRAVGRDLFVYAEQSAEGLPVGLKLVRSSDDGFIDLDRVLLDESVRDIESLDENIVLVETQERAYFLTLGGDRLHLRGSFDLPTNGRIVESALAGDHLLACVIVSADFNTLGATAALLELDASDLDNVTPLGTGPGCRSIAAYPEDSRAYATTFRTGRTSARVLALDIQEDGPALVRELELELGGVSADSVHVNDEYITLYQRSWVKVLRKAGLEQVVTATPRTRRGEITAARMTSRGLEVFERKLTLDLEGELTVYELRTDLPSGLSVRSHESLGPYLGGLLSGTLGWKSHEHGVRYGQQIFAFNEEAPFLRRVDDPDITWPGAAIVRGDAVHLRGSGHSIRMDISDPSAPRSAFGGAYESREGPSAFALDLTSGGTPELLWGSSVPVRASVGAIELMGDAGPLWLTGRTFDAQEEAMDLETREIGEFRDGTRLSRTDAYVYVTARSREGGAATVSGWRTRHFSHGPSADADLLLEVASPIGTSPDIVSRLHDDEGIAFTTHQPGAGSVLYWQALTSDSQPVGRFETDRRIIDIAVRGERLLALAVRSVPQDQGAGTGLIALALERRGDTLVEVRRHEWPAEDPTLDDRHQILHFDGQAIYLQKARGGGADVIGTRFDQLDGPFATYFVAELADPPDGVRPHVQSFAEADVGFVLALPNYFAILEPWCDSSMAGP